ncbi:STAS/SEC14 domain-containing protein [uncultured Tateyamaria sp.]|uniref:STAS/SEC14 domain-containing protein n=1 Tax=uncultured Tateyamaria sp. TaxID=455651 RepID=UPI00261A718C|nr:STAS/SEC14 domain-containing protein [uncultured Tateyamaria sp.]
MLTTNSITQVKTSRPDLYAFRITNKVTHEDMEAMAETMNHAFDSHDDKVDMLLIFDRYDGAETGATWSWEALKSRFKSITNVRRYVVVGAPDSAEDLIESMAKIMPVKAETHDTEIAAWRSLDAEAVAA